MICPQDTHTWLHVYYRELIFPLVLPVRCKRASGGIEPSPNWFIASGNYSFINIRLYKKELDIAVKFSV